MRLESLDKAIYKRWLAYGTIYGMTEYSFICLTNHTDNSVLSSFTTQYTQMFYLLIAQRASILKFKLEQVEIIGGIETFGKELTPSQINAIMDLEERVAAFDAQLNFSEISSQQQAIEMYRMFRENFGIQSEHEILKGQLEALYNISNTSLGYETNKKMYIFTAAGVILSMIGLFLTVVQIPVGGGENALVEYYWGYCFYDWLKPIVLVLGWCVIGIVVCAIYYMNKYMRKRKRK